MRHQRLLFWLMLLLGLGIRLGLALSRPDDLTSDNDGYLAHARAVAAGSGFPGPYTGRPTAFRPPAYPILLGLLQASGFSDPVAVTLINLAASALVLVFVRTLAEQCGLTSGCALLAMLAVALDPLLLRYSVLPMTEVLCAALLVVAVVLFRARLGNEHPSSRSAVLSGIAFGAGTLVRPVVLISCGFLSLSALMPSLRLKQPLTLRCLVPAIVAGMVLLPWVIRNAVQFQKLIPATTHGGYTLALGNNPEFYRDVINGTDEFPWDGQALDAWQQGMIAESLREGIPQDDEPALDRWYYQKAVEAIKADPASFLKATVLRLQRFWALTTADNSVAARVSTGISVWYALIWSGLILERVARWRLRKTAQSSPAGDLWLVVLSFMLMHSVYWTDTRMRAPLMPILIVLSLCGWRHAFNWVSGLRRVALKKDVKDQPDLVSE